MRAAILTLNAGSTSLKATLRTAEREDRVLFAAEAVRANDVWTLQTGDRREQVDGEIDQAAIKVLERASTAHSAFDTVAVAHRIVHGADSYVHPCALDHDAVERLRSFARFAPQHQGPALDLIEAVRSVLPEAINIGCFDTAFHKTIPALHHVLPLPERLRALGYRRYGFHGLSFQSIAMQLAATRPDLRKVVVAHLGGGSSLCALHDGKSIATTMGLAFDIRQLRYAIAAADHGSFYRAARALDVEQSTLSRAISKLERSIGMPIFERSRAGVRMTLAGTAFIRGAKPMVATADKLVAMMRAAGQGRAGGLMLGHNSSVSAGNLRATMMSWRDANPDVEVQCVEADRSVLLAGLDTGEIDIAILMGATSHDGFRCEPLWSERMLAALPATHPLTERDVVHWTDLRGERFYLPAADPGAEMRDMLLGRLAVSGVTPDIQMHQCSRETILSILGGGSAVSIVCEGSTGARYPDLVYRPIHGEQGPALAGYAGYWRDENRNPALRRFLGFIKMRYALSFDFSHRLQ